MPPAAAAPVAWLSTQSKIERVSALATTRPHWIEQCTRHKYVVIQVTRDEEGGQAHEKGGERRSGSREAAARAAAEIGA